jgi:oxygen-independent coproporphyrinogen-3 oxidase
MMTINLKENIIESDNNKSGNIKQKRQMIYVHVPFCDKKCYYCDFVSFQNKTLVGEYFSALEKEIIKRKNNKLVTSIFIGGGTPTSVDGEYIHNVLKTIKENYTLSQDCEITIEANPKSTTKQKLEIYFKSGINRLSFGVQSLDEKKLALLGREQTREQVINAIKTAQEVGFWNISADLMLGLPLQTKNEVIEDLKTLINLGIQHFSAYMLILEPETKLGYLVKNKEIILPDDDETVEIYNSLYEFLKQNEFERYEVSNFAKDSLISRHNLGYWQMEEYLGFGVAAHSFENMQRQENSKNLVHYLKDEDVKTEIVSPEQNREEIIMLGLRTKFGVNKNIVKNSKNYDILLKEGFIFEEDNFVKVCPEKYGLLNSIIFKLVE